MASDELKSPAFSSWMEREINEEPEVLRRLLSEESPKVEELAQRILKQEFLGIMLAARGTSDNAAVFARYLFEIKNGMPCSLASPSVLNIYKSQMDLSRVIVLGITQSGESVDVVQTLRSARELGAYTVGITNVENSAITHAAHGTLFCHAGEEKSVAATKTYLAELGLLMLLSAHLSRDVKRIEEMNKMPLCVEAALSLAPVVNQRVERYRFMEECVVLGRGYNFATALEIALKLKESCYIVAEPFSSADFMHGPIAVVERGFPVIVFLARGPVAPMVREVVSSLKEKHAETLIFTNDESALSLSQSVIYVDIDESDEFAALGLTALGQIFACHLAQIRGATPDRPRHLKKITKTF